MPSYTIVCNSILVYSNMLHDFESELGHTFGHAARHVVSIISADQRKLPERLPEHQRPIFPLTKECEKACVCICICICICIYIYIDTDIDTDIEGSILGFVPSKCNCWLGQVRAGPPAYLFLR